MTLTCGYRGRHVLADAGGSCIWAECRYRGSLSHLPSVDCQIPAHGFHWVSPFLSDSWAARFWTASTTTWCYAIISGCSVKGSICTNSSWWTCSMGNKTWSCIIPWAGVCISSNWVLSHSHLYPYIYNVLGILVWETGQGPGPLRSNDTQILERVQTPRELGRSPLTSLYRLGVSAEMGAYDYECVQVTQLMDRQKPYNGWEKIREGPLSAFFFICLESKGELHILNSSMSFTLTHIPSSRTFLPVNPTAGFLQWQVKKWSLDEQSM